MEKRFFHLNILAKDLNSVFCLDDGKVIVNDDAIKDGIVNIEVDNTFNNFKTLCELGVDFYEKSEWYCFIIDFKRIHAVTFWKENKQ